MGFGPRARFVAVSSVVISDDHTVINVEGLRYAKDEPACVTRSLDAVGDLALAGAPFIGCYRSYRGGHKMNANALKALLSDPSACEVVETRHQASASRRAISSASTLPEFAPGRV